MFFTMTFEEIEAAVLQLDASALNCSMKIIELRRTADELCVEEVITLEQWQGLVDHMAKVRAYAPFISGMPQQVA
jgi:hypothetical protein